MGPVYPHLGLLESRSHTDAALTLLKIPTGQHQWQDITVAQFHSDVEAVARYWTTEFAKSKISRKSPIGIWVKGTTYTDLVQIWAISRAGFIPHLISLRLPSPKVVYEMLDRSGAAGLVHDESLSSVLCDAPVPLFKPRDPALRQDDISTVLSDLPTTTALDDTTLIFHTSGSTSGSPKLMAVTGSWMNFSLQKGQQLDFYRAKESVIAAFGSFCHLANWFLFCCCLNAGSCFLLPTSIPYSSSELISMVENEGLEYLTLFPTFLAMLFEEARHDSALLRLMKESLKSIMYGGGALDPAVELWARSEGFRIFNCFASTEASLMLLSDGGWDSEHNAPTLQPFIGTKYEFVPLPQPCTTNDASQEKKQLLELHILPESPDCPPPSFRDKDTNKFHTGDLFREISPGHFVSQGRNDDWIKMDVALRCNTVAIENNTLQTCGQDLIDAAVVVGSGRPSPVLIVEPKDNALMASGEKVKDFKDLILSRILPFHERRYLHERITTSACVIVVDKGSLPRTSTKGNIRRKEAETHYREMIDRIFIGQYT